MPAAIPVNLEAVKTLCIAIGVRKAARQMDLPESTVKSWCTRGKWLAPRQPVPQPPTVISQKPLASNASMPSDALANVLSDHSKATRLGLAIALGKAASSLAKKSGDQVIGLSKAAVNLSTAADKVHSWGDKSAGGIHLQIGVSVGGME